MSDDFYLEVEVISFFIILNILQDEWLEIFLSFSFNRPFSLIRSSPWNYFHTYERYFQTWVWEEKSSIIIWYYDSFKSLKSEVEVEIRS